MKMANKYKGSPLFNDIKDVRLQTWNRCAITFNLAADRGRDAAKEYIGKFGDEDRVRISNMFKLIEKFGYEAIRKQCTPKELQA